MSKHHCPIVLFVVSLLLISCNDKVKPYAEYLKEETKAIERFIRDNKIVVLSDFPANATFAPNEYYRDPATGVYFNIMEKGTVGEEIKVGEEFYVRYSGLRYFADGNDTITRTNEFSVMPAIITYRGLVTMRNRELYSETTPAWIVPMPHIRHGARVKMIVPFNMGSYSDRTGYRNRNTTTYYGEVKYRFDSES